MEDDQILNTLVHEGDTLHFHFIIAKRRQLSFSFAFFFVNMNMSPTKINIDDFAVHSL